MNDGRFTKGHIPWLKGTKGLIKPNKGSFKKGQVSLNKGKKASPELKKKLSDAHKGQPAYWKGKKIPQYAKDKMRIAKILRPPKVFKDTSIELKVEEELKKRGIFYRKQVPLCKVAIVDFFLPNKLIAIQCDGDYWHNLPDHKARDKNQDEVLIKNGYQVYRFWEHEINKSVSDCFNKINFYD